MIVYLASPYSINSTPELRELRYELVEKKCAELMQEGHIVFCPIASSHHLSVKHGLPNDWEYWKRLDREFIACCGELWVYCLPEWDKSKGVTEEIQYATDIGIPVKYIKFEDELSEVA